jgi:PEP-CTERM motif
MTISKFLSAAVLSAGVMLACAPAHALVIVPISTGPFSLPGNPSGVIPAGTFAVGTNTYDFTFTTVGATYSTLMQMQTSIVATGNPDTLSFKLFKGLPGSGVFIANSGGTTTAATLVSLTAGSYYMELQRVSVPQELVTGGLTLLKAVKGGGVPEPAVWTTMLVGFGALGAVLRRRRSYLTA